MAALMATGAAMASRDVATREHRSVWMTPYLSSNWPSSTLTSQTNVNNNRRVIENRMKAFKRQNINVVYFHVRSMADALYKSSYEPWSYKVAGTRGGTPVGDPLQIIIEAAHANGIEIYAWVNPYRYSSSGLHGAGELNYETTHPDWLCQVGNNIILNPGKPEVTQRIVDVISEIVTNYDIDGVLYDDYFYISKMSESLDKAEYDAYKAGVEKPMSQADWRRDNVNNMVKRVNSAIKAIKPYVAFGVSPAGVACPAKTPTAYGLPMVSGDWQYDGIFSDPLAWLAAGDIDYMSPQIYWPNRWDELSAWWAKATQKYNRHLYPSVDISEISKGQTQEFVREALDARAKNPADCSGFVFFQYDQLVNFYENLYGKSMSLADNFAEGAFTTKALTPLRPWANKVEPRMTANVKRSDGTLTWDEVPGMRYTVYAVPAGSEGDFACQREYLDGISYTNSYAIPQDKASGYTWAVAVYDRYGNEYSPLFEGAAVTAPVAAKLTFPADGARASYMSDLTWESTGRRFILEVAADRAFDNIVAMLETDRPSANITDLTELVPGQTYYWRVRVSTPNAPESVSDVRSFVASKLSILTPSAGAAGISHRGFDITCDEGLEGTTYTFSVSGRGDLGDPVFTAEVGEPKVTVPAGLLCSGSTYYVGVTASSGNVSAKSDVVTFTTANVTDYAVPKFVIPSATSGTTVHANEAFTVEPWEGMKLVTVQLSSSTSFPTRTSTTITLSAFETKTKNLSELKLSSKALVDGNTYYVRCRGGYSIIGSNANKYTDYSAAHQFVYSAQNGIGDVADDARAAIYVDSADVLHFGADTRTVSVYTVSGALAAAYTVKSGESLSLASLPAGVYIITVTGDSVANLKWLKN